MTTNKDVAQHLHTCVALMTIAGENSFKIRAISNVAKEFSTLPPDQLNTNFSNFPGMGPGTLKTIQEYIATGSSSRLQSLSKDYPVEIMQLTLVTGIGPKKAWNFWQQGIRSLQDLKQYALDGKVKGQLRDTILATSQEENKRVDLHLALEVAQTLLRKVETIPGVEKVTIAGSIRRKKSTIKDVDLAVQVSNSANKLTIAQAFSSFGETLNVGEAKSSIKFHHNGILLQSDMWLTYSNSYGALLNHTTGSKLHNIRLRSLAKERGYIVNEYGIFDGDKQLGGKEESDLYKVLGLEWCSPESREG